MHLKAETKKHSCSMQYCCGLLCLQTTHLKLLIVHIQIVKILTTPFATGHCKHGDAPPSIGREEIRMRTPSNGLRGSHRRVGHPQFQRQITNGSTAVPLDTLPTQPTPEIEAGWREGHRSSHEHWQDGSASFSSCSHRTRRHRSHTVLHALAHRESEQGGGESNPPPAGGFQCRGSDVQERAIAI